MKINVSDSNQLPVIVFLQKICPGDHKSSLRTSRTLVVLYIHDTDTSICGKYMCARWPHNKFMIKIIYFRYSPDPHILNILRETCQVALAKTRYARKLLKYCGNIFGFRIVINKFINNQTVKQSLNTISKHEYF
jgi:hypothetical protein